MKKSLLLIKALIIVFWSTQVSLAQQRVDEALTKKIIIHGKLLASTGPNIGWIDSYFLYEKNVFLCQFKSIGIIDGAYQSWVECYFPKFSTSR